VIDHGGSPMGRVQQVFCATEYLDRAQQSHNNSRSQAHVKWLHKLEKVSSIYIFRSRTIPGEASEYRLKTGVCSLSLETGARSGL